MDYSSSVNTDYTDASNGNGGVSVNHADTIDYNQFCRKGQQDYISGLLHDILGDVALRCLPSNQKILRQQISQFQLDFLIFADLGMDFATYALSHARLARYQVTPSYTLSHPGLLMTDD